MPAVAPKADWGLLADRLRAALSARELSEQRMFGGIGFMLNGNMIAGVSKRGLLLRVGKDSYHKALARPGASPMEMRDRPVEGYVYIDPAGLNEEALSDWLQLALTFVRTLPPKPMGPKARQRKETRT
jgi:TfoX/Sxy family transcriptional regulator of competence genes